MADQKATKDGAEIQAILGRITAAWREGRVDELCQYFHPDVIVRGPGFELVARGRDACVNSYADFIRQAVVREFNAGEPSVDVMGQAAVAICPWEIAYEMQGQSYRESGHDVFILTLANGAW